MGYYDNVKDDVKETDDTSKPNFDTLRKAAEENDNDEEQHGGDDTDIEVLEDGLDKSSSGSSSSGIKELGGDSQNSSSDSGALDSSSEGSTSDVSADMSGVEDKLDKIIEQNERMIDILESFGS